MTISPYGASSNFLRLAGTSTAFESLIDFVLCDCVTVSTVLVDVGALVPENFIF